MILVPNRRTPNMKGEPAQAADFRGLAIGTGNPRLSYLARPQVARNITKPREGKLVSISFECIPTQFVSSHNDSRPQSKSDNGRRYRLKPNPVQTVRSRSHQLKLLLSAFLTFRP